MEIQIFYSGKNLKFELPLPFEQVSFLNAPDPKPTEELETTVQKALTEPYGSPRLSEILRPSSRVAIIFEDWTRNTPVDRIIPLLLREIQSSGVASDRIKLICANGMHDPVQMTKERLLNKLGEEILGKYKIISHDAYDKNNSSFVGVTKCLGTPLFINKHVAEADIKIAVGKIVPHGDVGYSGGAKMIMPGVADLWTIIHHHTGSFPHRGLLENPLRNDIEECGRLAGLNFILNVVTNSQGHVLRAFAGEPQAAHRRGVAFGNEFVWGAKIAEPADILICSPGPWAEDYFMTSMRCLSIAHTCLKKNGAILIVSSCRNGWTTREYLDLGWHVGKELLDCDYPELWRLMITRAWHEPRRQFQALVYFVQHIAKTCHERNVILAGAKGVTADEIRKLNVKFYESPNQAMKDIVAEYGPATRAFVVPDCFTLPLRDFHAVEKENLNS